MTSSTARRPNIAFVLTDDHGAGAVGAYGSVVNRTPHIDAIGAAGVRFEKCFVTNSLCAPSRASILTGTHSHVNGVRTLRTFIDASQPTFVSLLREAGYRTAIVGKWHMGDGSTDGVSHDPQGFDHWDVLIDQGEYVDPRFLSEAGLRVEQGYATDVITDLALGWLESLDGDAPWCLLVCHKAPHRPWEPDEAQAGLYRDPVPVPATFDDDHATRSASTRRAEMRVADDLTESDLKQPVPAGLSPEEEARWRYQRWMEDYLACVASVDDNVGRLVDALRERGELDDTVLVYSSDQGFFLGDHGWFDKRFMYEESLRMPLLLSAPGRVPAGSVHDGIVTNVDFAQTLLEAAGVPSHPRMQGRSFWGDITRGGREAGAGSGPESSGMYYRYWENDDPSHRAPAHYGYRSDRYKLIYFYNDGMGLPGCGPAVHPPEWELYDLEADPHELRNVWAEPAYRDVRDDLTRRLWLEQRRLGDEPHPSQPVPAGLEEEPS